MLGWLHLQSSAEEPNAGAGPCLPTLNLEKGKVSGLLSWEGKGEGASLKKYSLPFSAGSLLDSS